MKSSLWIGPGALVLAALCAACGGTVVQGQQGGTTGAGASTVGSTGDTTGDGAGGAISSGPGPGSGGFGGEGGTGGAGGGAVCGGLAGFACPPGNFCQFTSQSCGGDDDEGVCVPDPTGCDDIYEPRCGCDHKVYPNECEANAAGVDIGDFGGCTPPGGLFDCGVEFCDVGTEFCMIESSDVGNEPSTATCLPLPTTCGSAPDCACLAEEQCGSLCMTSPDGGGLQVICPGG